MCLSVALLTAALAQRSLGGLDPPPSGPVRSEVTLVSDPEPDGRGGVRVDVRLGERRYGARAHAAAAAALDDRLAGDRVSVVGDVRPPGRFERLQLHRHLAGRLQVETVVGWRPGHGVTRAANALRRTLASGAEVLPERQRSLLAGLTLGDDRDQPADMTDAFRGAGLTHLLAVSGQNVAFALLLVAPLLVRLRFAPRLAATLGVLAGFALLTRFEPSVVRATAMAAVAATGAALGRPTTSLRTLALGVTALLLVDPLLASSLGFQLSALATAGIVVGASALQRALPGPRWLTAPLSITLAAQLAVSPLLIAAFGSVPLASVPANLLAGPAAGPVMVWGMTAGFAAGLTGGAAASVLHLPTRALLAWIEGVALTTSGWPLGDVGPTTLVALTLGAVLLAAGRAAGHAFDGPGSGPDAETGVRQGRSVAWPLLRWLGVAVTVAALGAAVVPSRPVPSGRVDVAIGATAWRAGGAAVLVLDGRAIDRYVLTGARDSGIRTVDVIVVRTAARTAAETVATLERRWPDAQVLAPVDAGSGPAPVDGATSPEAGTVLDVGGLRLAVRANAGGRLDVDIGPRPRAPPR